MNVERIRTILGVWMPMVIGLWIIGTSVLFYETADLSPGGIFRQDLEPWRLVCSGGVFFVGALLLLSTYGRYRKARDAKSVAEPGQEPPVP